ncbi:MAG TPA: hypothetical protein VEB66_11655 [Opitutaceae bacterium]|nr:hypothetical protein [Opitutaceae bacterium]
MRPHLLLLLSLVPLALAGRAEERLRPATPDEVALLKEALKNSAQQTDHWAYTETRAMKLRKGGKAAKETIVRFDPSKPYAEQFTPLKVEGREPSKKDLKEYREKGEKRGEALARAAERREDSPPPADAAAPAKPKKGGKEVRADLENPLVAGEEGDRLVLEIPMVSTTKDIPADKFEVRVVLNRSTRHVERASLRIRDAFRVKGIAKVKGGEGTVEFTLVDPAHGPVLTSATGKFGGSLMLLPVNPSFSYQRTEVKRVKPYDERFQVEVGALETLDF